MKIPCPWCGTRDLAEFTFGGPGNIVRPENPQSVSDEDWADYLYYRDNPKGLHLERWVHTWGCRQWFNLVRDTVSHEIHLPETPPESQSEVPADGSSGK